MVMKPQLKQTVVGNQQPTIAHMKAVTIVGALTIMAIFVLVVTGHYFYLLSGGALVGILLICHFLSQCAEVAERTQSEKEE